MGNVNADNVENAENVDNTESIDEAGLGDALVSRLTVIEDQPLESRAAAYAQLHDQLRERLEGGDQPRSSKG